MPDVISGVIFALTTHVMYCFAGAKIDKNPETRKEFREKFTQNLLNLMNLYKLSLFEPA